MQKLLILLLLLTFNFAYADESKNDLQYETSPYLKQHESDPIKWMAWNDKAFKKAKAQNKPIFVSIGFSTCHWCHVMQDESFSQTKIANLLNKYFVAIKVDREEMPHLDSYYQELYQKVKHRAGGWPLMIFLNADKKPFYISTYIPPVKASYSDSMQNILLDLGSRYQKNYSSITKKIMDMKNRNNVIHTKPKAISAKTLRESILKNYDKEEGGFGERKKFPEAARVSLMMDLSFLQDDKDMLKKAYLMLDRMALRGLYDHLGGGFFRYTTQATWEIAHFEKMLYNQAELIPLYVRAYNLTHKKLYKTVVLETIDMVNRRLEKDNLFYSASDTDSDNKEGYYFTFTPKEIDKALKDNKYSEDIEEALGFTILGNFHNSVHLNFYTDARPKGFKQFKYDLMKIRSKKEYPFIDKKINTAWNAMMIEALYKSSSIDDKYRIQADNHLKALQELMFVRGNLYHQTILGVPPKQLGLLEDYSFLISALLSGYEVDYDEQKLNFARYLLVHAKDKFYRDGTWYLSNDKLNIKANLNDKYYTSALSKMIQNTLKLASLEESFKYEKLATKSLVSINHKLSVEQSNAPAAAIAFLMKRYEVVTLKTNKQNFQKDISKIRTIQYPYLLRKVIDDEGYLSCTIGRCFSKENNIDDSIKAIMLNSKRD
ncbi:MAG: DUF255 domain-containing protein [Sulfurimonas sp.]